MGTYEGWVHEVPSLLLITPSGAGKMAQQLKTLTALKIWVRFPAPKLQPSVTSVPEDLVLSSGTMFPEGECNCLTGHSV